MLMLNKKRFSENQNQRPDPTLAESSDGFVWRCKIDDDGAENYLIDGDPLMVANLSVWASVSDLHNFYIEPITSIL